MGLYTHILVGLDLSEDSASVLKKAETLSQTLGAKLSLVHIIEPLTFAYAGDLPVDLTDTQTAIQEHASERLKSLADALSEAPVRCEVVLGATAVELRQFAQDSQADLIVVGTHGRHGFALLLGSTATDVIHGTPCDVLAVKI